MSQFGRKNGIHNFIIYVTLISFLVTVPGLGMDENSRIVFRSNSGQHITRQVFTNSDNIETLKLQDNTLALVSVKGMHHNNRSRKYGQNAKLLLFILLLILGVFRFIHVIYGFYLYLFIRRRMLLITYIHNKDGRKRLSL